MSNETQLKGDSLRRQFVASNEYALANNLQLVDSIDGTKLADLGISAYKGKNSQQGVLGVFLDALENGKIEPNSVLIVESLDRLSRDKLLTAFNQFTNILNKGIEIVTLADKQKYTKEILNESIGSLFISLGVMFRANDESEMKSKRLKASWSNKRANAPTKVLTKTCPAWLSYDATTQKLTSNKNKEKVVQKIFQLCIDTCGISRIAKYLNENKIPVFGSSAIWYQSYVKKILFNRAVLGEFQPHMITDGKRIPSGEIVENYFPQIVDEQTFLLAHAALNRRRVKSRGRKGEFFTNLFTGFIYCGKCGNKMALRNRGVKSNTKTLICVMKREGAACNMPEWPIDIVEKRILQHLKEIDFSSLLNVDQSKNNMLTSKVESLTEQLKVKNGEAQNATDFVISGGLSEESKGLFTTKLNQIHNEIGLLNEHIQIAKSELRDEELNSESMKSDSLKKLIKKMETNTTDYFLRSSVNQLISKYVESIFLYDTNLAKHQPWDFDEGSTEVINFRKSGSKISALDLEKLIIRREFVNFANQYNKRISIKYVTGGAREVFGGYNASILMKREKKKTSS